MTEKSLLYDFPVRVIEDLVSSELYNDYVAGLPATSADAYSDIIDTLDSHLVNMKDNCANSLHYAEWNLLQALVGQLITQFPDHPNSDLKSLRLFSAIATQLADTGSLSSNAIAVNVLIACNIDLPCSYKCMIDINANNLAGALALFDCSKVDEILSLLNTAGPTIPTDIIHYLLDAVRRASPIASNNIAILMTCFPMPIPSAEAVAAFVKLKILMNGQTVQDLIVHSIKPEILDRSSLVISNDYSQWKEAIHVLNEYVGRHDLLIKYLTLYHVLENLMIKRIIVQLESEASGRFFSIRDFKRYYSETSDKEKPILNKLINCIDRVQLPSGIAFKDHVITRWNTLTATLTPDDVKTFLKRLGISNVNLSTTNFYTTFTDIIYSLRNAIVHNKETEFHLTYGNLSAPFKAILAGFIIPSIEELCFHFVCSKNQDVWYDKDHLMLY